MTGGDAEQKKSMDGRINETIGNIFVSYSKFQAGYLIINIRTSWFCNFDTDEKDKTIPNNVAFPFLDIVYPGFLFSKHILPY